MGLLIYLMIGSVIAYRQIISADKWHEEGIMDDDEYLDHKYFKPRTFSIITLFWLPSIINSQIEINRKKG